MSIHVITGDTLNAKLAREREYVTRVIADAVEGLPPEDCDHRPRRQSCARCDERRTVVADAAALIRKIGGVKP
jgi:hypothetical protein